MHYIFLRIDTLNDLHATRIINHSKSMSFMLNADELYVFEVVPPYYDAEFSLITNILIFIVNLFYLH